MRARRTRDTSSSYVEEEDVNDNSADYANENDTSYEYGDAEEGDRSFEYAEPRQQSTRASAGYAGGDRDRTASGGDRTAEADLFGFDAPSPPRRRTQATTGSTSNHQKPSSRHTTSDYSRESNASSRAGNSRGNPHNGGGGRSNNGSGSSENVMSRMQFVHLSKTPSSAQDPDRKRSSVVSGARPNTTSRTKADSNSRSRSQPGPRNDRNNTEDDYYDNDEGVDEEEEQAERYEDTQSERKRSGGRRYVPKTKKRPAAATNKKEDILTHFGGNNNTEASQQQQQQPVAQPKKNLAPVVPLSDQHHLTTTNVVDLDQLNHMIASVRKMIIDLISPFLSAWLLDLVWLPANEQREQYHYNSERAKVNLEKFRKYDPRRCLINLIGNVKAFAWFLDVWFSLSVMAWMVSYQPFGAGSSNNNNNNTNGNSNDANNNNTSAPPVITWTLMGVKYETFAQQLCSQLIKHAISVWHVDQTAAIASIMDACLFEQLCDVHMASMIRGGPAFARQELDTRTRATSEQFVDMVPFLGHRSEWIEIMGNPQQLPIVQGGCVMRYELQRQTHMVMGGLSNGIAALVKPLQDAVKATQALHEDLRRGDHQQLVLQQTMVTELGRLNTVMVKLQKDVESSEWRSDQQHQQLIATLQALTISPPVAVRQQVVQSVVEPDFQRQAHQQHQQQAHTPQQPLPPPPQQQQQQAARPFKPQQEPEYQAAQAPEFDRFLARPSVDPAPIARQAAPRQEQQHYHHQQPQPQYAPPQQPQQKQPQAPPPPYSIPIQAQSVQQPQFSRGGGGGAMYHANAVAPSQPQQQQQPSRQQGSASAAANTGPPPQPAHPHKKNQLTDAERDLMFDKMMNNNK